MVRATMKQRSRQARNREAQHRPATPWPVRLRTVLLGAFAALLVATPLLPSEAAATHGTGVVLIMAWWVLLVAWLAAGLLERRLEMRAGPVLLAVLALVGWHALGKYGWPAKPSLVPPGICCGSGSALPSSGSWPANYCAQQRNVR